MIGLVTGPRRWANRRVLCCIGAVLALLVVGSLVVWLLPAVLTRHPSAGMTSAERLKAINDVRGSLIAFLIVVGGAGTLSFTGWTYLLNREGQVTDRYTKAIGQLGDTASPVRIGGIYALERIGNDSLKDRKMIIFVLGAFIRERSKAKRERRNHLPEDIYAALRVTGRLLRVSDTTLDLRGADLRFADLSPLPPDRVLLDGAKLYGAKRPSER